VLFRFPLIVNPETSSFPVFVFFVAGFNETGVTARLSSPFCFLGRRGGLRGNLPFLSRYEMTVPL